jgi:ATP-dependent RNA helicase RhlE
LNVPSNSIHFEMRVGAPPPDAAEPPREAPEAAFADLKLIDPLQRAVREEGYSRPTPIQEQAIPILLEGRDLLGCARTGTGKTAAFALPILQRLAARPAHGRTVRALVLVPTRELAAQVGESFRTYGRHVHASVAVIYGGVGQDPQVRALQRGVDVVVATPGRLVDLMGQGYARLGSVEILVLDEADHMLDLGFLPDVRRILATLPKQRQTLLFSATMPPAIAALAHGILVHPAKVIVTPEKMTVEEVTQGVHFVLRSEKPAMLAKILSDDAVQRALVFTRTKHGADRVARWLLREGIPTEAIHGNKSQNHRERTLHGFKRGRVRVLVATDIAARGIDVDEITHVVNFDLPNVPETYVHRIGRTARAGASGIAISLCDPDERPFLRDIEKLIRRSVPVLSGDPRARGDSHRRPDPLAASHRSHPSHASHQPPRDARRHDEAVANGHAPAARSDDRPHHGQGGAPRPYASGHSLRRKRFGHGGRNSGRGRFGGRGR